MSRIEIEPLAGLANRMRVISAAYWLSQDLGKDLLVSWTPYKGLNCRYDQLFKNNSEFEVRNRSADIFHENRLFDLYFRVKALSFQAALNLVRSGSLDQDTIERLKNKKSILIASVHQFYAAERALAGFEPIESLQERIGLVTERFNTHTMGVHIRRTDHKLAISKSSTDRFIRVMRQAVKTEPETNFFLSTDNPEEEARLLEEFGSRIIQIEKVYSRNTSEGIEAALVDLFCLSATRKILGSYFSSFSEVAAKVRGIPLEIIQ